MRSLLSVSAAASVFLSLVIVACPVGATDLVVTNDAELDAALSSAQPGDRVLLSPDGVFQGGLFRSGLTGVTLTSQDPSRPATITGGTTNLQLSDVTDVTISHLIFDGAAVNGINIDDGGSFDTPSTGIGIDSVTVQNLAGGGNHDSIKLSGVTGFRIERSVITTPNSASGSAIDMVGSHHGVIANNRIEYPNSGGGSGIRPKGGSKDIRIVANRLDLGQGRPIQFGGSTGPEFFRFLPGEGGYEADDITAIGNIVTGGDNSASFVNIDGGTFAFNYFQDPANWVLRILNENSGSPTIVDTQNGSFRNNAVVYNDALRRIVNIGPETLPETLDFAGNAWFNSDGGPADQAALQLPSVETGGTYGVDIRQDPDAVVRFEEGPLLWLVNPSLAPQAVTLPEVGLLHVATPQNVDAAFDPTGANQSERFLGDWAFAPLSSPTVNLERLSDVVLVAILPGDYDGSGQVEQGDLDIVLQNWGTATFTGDEAALVGGGPFDGTVDQNELDGVLQNWGGAAAPDFDGAAVPEPVAALALLGLAGRRTTRRVSAACVPSC